MYQYGLTLESRDQGGSSVRQPRIPWAEQAESL